MLVTINTDASFYTDFKAGSYAFWISSSIGRVKMAGRLKGEIMSSHEAEFKAILNALHTTGKTFKGTKKIIINTDCQAVILAIASDKPKNEWAKPLIAEYNRMKDMLGCDIELRHVKAHKDTKTARTWVNNWCDKQAKKILKDKFGRNKK